MAMSLDGLSSGMDTASIVEQLVAMEREPIYRYEDEISEIEEKKGAWRDVNSRISKLGDKLSDLKYSSTFNSRSAESSNEDVLTASASNDAAEAIYDLDVSQLAEAHRVASDQQDAGETFTGGEISINGNAINISDGSTLSDIRDTINNTENLGATASIIDNTLVLEADETGTDNSLELTDNTGNVLETLGVINNDGSIKNTEQERQAQNAKLTINGIDVENQSNTIDQAVEGMKFEIQDLGSAEVEVAKDTEKAATAVQDFVDQYNSIMNFIDSKSNYNAEEEEGAILQGDSTLMRVQSRLRQSVMDSVDTGGDLSHVSELGISINRDGVMSLDNDQLTEAINNDSEAVSKFFNAETDEDGFTGLANRLDSYTDQLIRSNTGVIPSRISSFDSRINSLNESIDDVEDKVEMARERYTEQFTAMETALSDMQQQQSWMQNQLSSLGSQSLTSMLQ